MSWRPEACATAYADDLAIIIYENSRTKLEEKAPLATDIICSWCESYKLQIATNKTKAILIKRNLHRERMLRITVHGKKIEFVSEHKYLGVYFDKKLSFLSHVQYLRDKIIALAAVIRKTVQEEWGLRRKAYTLLYKCLYIPVMVYGVETRYERTIHSHVKRILSSIQRKLLLTMTRACRTSSTAAIQVIAGCILIELEIIQKALVTKIRRKEHVTWNTYYFDPDDDLSGK